MNKQKLFALMLVALCHICTVLAQKVPGKFAPVDGKTMLVIGQDLGSVQGYVDSGKFPTPAGVTMYTDLYSMAGLTDITNYGAGDMGLQEAMDRHPNSALAIGFWMVEEADGEGEDHPNGLTELVNGQHDDELDKFAAFAKNNDPRPIYFRIGYEFDGPWNGYDANKYVAAYKYIVDYLNDKNVTNIAYVWQSATYGDTQANGIDAYYPGDEYVDYVGLSFFFYAEGFNDDNFEYLINFARNKNKPVMMAEVSAQYYEFDQGTFHPFDNPGSPQNLGGEGIWNQYFRDQLIPFIEGNDDIIRIVAYINADWQSQELWEWPTANAGFWGDTRIEADEFISTKWNEYINNGDFLHGGPNLLRDLGIEDGDDNEPTCDDGEQNGDETGIDCGGSCAPCDDTPDPTCDDGEQNGDETGIDCGGSCTPCDDTPNPDGTVIPLLPPNDQILLTIGQDLKTVSDYDNSGKGFPTMGGVTQYVAFYSLLDPSNPQYGALGEDANGTPTGNDINWGAGPLNASSGAVGFPNSSLSIGMSLAEGNEFQTWCAGCLAQLGNGGWDDNIKRFAKFAKDHSDVAIYLRLGFEFDGAWNRYDSTQFKAAWRRFVDVMRSENVKNVAFVWQASASPVDDLIDGSAENIEDFWPGDEYVDWLGYSWFLAPDRQFGNALTQRKLAQEVVDLARRKNKPVKLCESSPQGYDISDLTKCNIVELLDGEPKTGCENKTPDQIWNEWFVPFFSYIYDNADVIRGVDYINVNWDEDTDKFGAGSDYAEGYWGDARVQANNDLASKWLQEISKPIWLHGSSTLNNTLINGNVLSVDELTPDTGKFVLYPNPANGLVNIYAQNIKAVSVYDMSGRRIQNITIKKTDQSISFDITSVKTGIYLVVAQDSQNHKITKRLLVE